MFILQQLETITDETIEGLFTSKESPLNISAYKKTPKLYLKIINCIKTMK